MRSSRFNKLESAVQNPITFLVSSFLALSTIAPLLAQPGGRRNATLPLQGKKLPKIQAFNEDGQLFSTASLKGSYTVLVFGCLT